MQYANTILLLLLIFKIYKMSTELDKLNTTLDAVNAKVAKVGADVTELHRLISEQPEVPTEEQWAEIQAKADDALANLTAVDEQTEDVPATDEPTE